MAATRMTHSGRMGLVAMLCAAAISGGCVNLSGLDAQSNFKCAAPDGVSCMSISGVSANVDRNNLPSSIKTREKEELTRDLDGKDGKKQKSEEGPRPESLPFNESNSPEGLSPASMQAIESGTPIRIPPKELRIWIAPMQDSDGDLEEQRYVYVVVHDGRWMVDAARLNTRSKYTRFQPLVNPSNTPGQPPQQTMTQREPATVQPAQPQPQAQQQGQMFKTGG